MKMSLSLFALAAIALTAMPAHAQSVAKSGQQCSKGAIQTATELDCINSEAGPDIRLYVEEFAQCDNQGNIIASSFDRDVAALLPSGNYLDPDAGDSLPVKFSSKRTHIDWIPGDNFSMIMPQSAVIKDGSNTFTLTITTQTELDYDGAPSEESHFKGSFVETDSSGKKIASGKLACGIDM